MSQGAGIYNSDAYGDHNKLSGVLFRNKPKDNPLVKLPAVRQVNAAGPIKIHEGVFYLTKKGIMLKLSSIQLYII